MQKSFAYKNACLSMKGVEEGEGAKGSALNNTKEHI